MEANLQILLLSTLVYFDMVDMTKRMNTLDYRYNQEQKKLPGYSCQDTETIITMSSIWIYRIHTNETLPYAVAIFRRKFPIQHIMLLYTASIPQHPFVLFVQVWLLGFQEPFLLQFIVQESGFLVTRLIVFVLFRVLSSFSGVSLILFIFVLLIFHKISVFEINLHVAHNTAYIPVSL